MAGELKALTGRPGRTCYFLILDRNSLIWNGSAFETYATGNYLNYDIAATEVGTNLGLYKATMPASISPGVYDIVMKEQTGVNPVEGDSPVAMQDSLQWGGTATLPLSDMATSGQVSNALPIRIARGVMLQNFPLYLKSAADHITPMVSGIVSGQIARDAGAFGPLQSGNITEVGLGYYNVNLTSGDLNATTVKLVFTGRQVSGGNSDPLPFSFILQRTSGGQ